MRVAMEKCGEDPCSSSFSLSLPPPHAAAGAANRSVLITGARSAHRILYARRRDMTAAVAEKRGTDAHIKSERENYVGMRPEMRAVVFHRRQE